MTMNFRHTPDLPLAVGELHASAHNLFNLTHKVVEAASYSTKTCCGRVFPNSPAGRVATVVYHYVRQKAVKIRNLLLLTAATSQTTRGSNLVRLTQEGV